MSAKGDVEREILKTSKLEHSEGLGFPFAIFYAHFWFKIDHREQWSDFHDMTISNSLLLAFMIILNNNEMTTVKDEIFFR